MRESNIEDSIDNLLLGKTSWFIKEQKTIVINSINQRKRRILKVGQRKNFLTKGHFRIQWNHFEYTKVFHLIKMLQ